MRYVVFSDIHGNAEAFRSFLADIKNVEYDRVIFLGDFIGYYYAPEEIISYCIDHKVICLRGNHDQYFLDMIDGLLEEDVLVARYGYSYSRAKETISSRSITFLRSLSPSLSVDDEQKNRILFCHGSPLDPLNGRIYPNTDLTLFEDSARRFSYVVSGHTHHKMLRMLGDTVFVNPGSLGQQRDGRGCSYTVLDTVKKKVDFRTISYDISTLEALIDRYDGGNVKLKSVLRREPAKHAGETII